MAEKKKKLHPVTEKIRATRAKKGANFADTTGDSILDPFNDDREIWEQQEHESDSDYALFMKYASAPASKRTHKEFAKYAKVTIYKVQQKSSRKKWRTRVEALTKWRREAQREELKQHFAKEAKSVYDDFAKVSKLLSEGLGAGIDVSTIENHLSRAYAIREMAVIKSKLIEQAKELLGEEADGLKGEVTAGDGNITVTFRTKKKDTDDGE